MRSAPRLRSRRLVAPVVLAAALCGAGVGGVAVRPVAGAPIADLEAQAQDLAARIEANAEQAAHLSEQIKYAEDRLATADATVADARARIEAARLETERLAAIVREQAAVAYRSATGARDVSVFSVRPSQANRLRRYGAAAAAEDDRAMVQLARARDTSQLVQAEAEAAARAAQAQRDDLDQKRAEFQAENAALGDDLAKVKGEIADLVAKAEAARRAAMAPRPSAATLASGGATFDPGTLPPASGKGAVVVAFAMAQLGKPYVYAGVGPDSYDCSGLTMAAWAAAGVSMGHNSESQYASFPRVPMSQLAPGDIVWGPGHVGIYVGNGAVIHAPHSGDVVRYIDVGYFRGAVRPG